MACEKRHTCVTSVKLRGWRCNLAVGRMFSVLRTLASMPLPNTRTQQERVLPIGHTQVVTTTPLKERSQGLRAPWWPLWLLKPPRRGACLPTSKRRLGFASLRLFDLYVTGIQHMLTWHPALCTVVRYTLCLTFTRL